jgi:multicomponent Na+:H+ antiporter subunit G
VTLFIELLSGFCLLAGGLLCISGGVGLLRMPDFFARVHAAGVTETLATPLLLLGLALQMEWSLDLFKVLTILAFILATNPTASHSMAKAALHGGRRPLVSGDDDAVAREDPSSKA